MSTLLKQRKLFKIFKTHISEANFLKSISRKSLKVIKENSEAGQHNGQ